MSRPSRPNIKPAKKNLMYSTERINNLPASITKTIPPLGDKIIRFRLLNIRKDENGKWKVPFMKGIPSKDRIVDPATKKIYDIANIVRIGINDNPEIQTPFFTSGDAGRISINPQRAEDINLYEYLWISNYNASNPLRDKTKAAIYELEDESKDAERFLDKQAIRLSALQRVAVMSDDEVKVIGGASGLTDPGDEITVIRRKLMSFADENPKGFHDLDARVSGNTEYYAIVRRAMDAKIVFLDKKGPAWKYVASNGKILSGLKGGDDETQIRNFADWLRNTEEGNTVFRIIKETLG